MNIERQRAAHALQTIEALPDDVNKYTSYVKGLPASILQNGLGQAMATLLAASKGDDAWARRPGSNGGDDRGKVGDAHRLLYNHLQAWLCDVRDDAPYSQEQAPDENSTALMEAITTGGGDAYIRAQAEALAYLNWLKKFAVAFRPEGEGS